jgi:hypothetical protein
MKAVLLGNLFLRFGTGIMINNEFKYITLITFIFMQISIHDTSEYLSVPQKFNFKNDHKQKPPWK